MSPQTFSEKILSFYSGMASRAGDYVVVPVHKALASDTTAPGAITAFRAMNGGKVYDPLRLHLVIDHASPAPSSKVANLHQMMRRFAEEQGCSLHDIGEGICHHIMIDKGYVEKDEIVLGADSHTCSYGAIGAFATGIGATDLAGIMKTGETWLRVPHSIKVVLRGDLPGGSTGKDLALLLNRKLHDQSVDTGFGTLEIWDETFSSLSLHQRLPLANMAIEMGAKNAIYLNRNEKSRFFPDEGAEYSHVLALDLEWLQPKIALPSSPDRVYDVCQVTGTPIQVAYLGSCTNNRIEDLRNAARILENKKISKGVRFLVAPPTRQVQLEAMEEGVLQTLVAAGATILPSGCGPCVGTHLGVPSDGETVISSANRNFQGRMGNPKSQVFLASAETVAASAIAGFIKDPRDLGGEACKA